MNNSVNHIEAISNAEALNRYRSYFNVFLPTILGQRLIEELKGLNCQVEIVVTDSGDAPWGLVIEDGCLAQVLQSGIDAPCRYLLDVQTLLDIVTGQCDPQEAFFDTRINIEGDMEQGLKLSTVLSIFFKRFPLNPEREG